MKAIAPLAPVDLAGWTRTEVNPFEHRLSGDAVTLVLSRSARSSLAAAYPVGSSDLLVTVEAGEPAAVGQALASLVPALWQADPKARRLLVAVEHEDAALTEALTRAGLAHAVAVDTAEGTTVTLFAAEPEHVRNEPSDIDDMPV